MEATDVLVGELRLCDATVIGGLLDSGIRRERGRVVYLRRQDDPEALDDAEMMLRALLNARDRFRRTVISLGGPELRGIVLVVMNGSDLTCI